jgi:DNA-binding NarL/FixJ family response regulator
LLTQAEPLAAPVRIVSATPRPDLEAAVGQLGYRTWHEDSLEPAVAVIPADEVDDKLLIDTRALREEQPDAIIVCLARTRLRRSGSVLAAGADAVLSDIESLPVAIAAARRGHVLIPRQALARRPKGRQTLSQRERELLALVVLGMTNGAIARRLHITESTVKSHLSSAFAKLAVRSRSEAVELILADEHLAAGIISFPGSRERLTLLSEPSTAN